MSRFKSSQFQSFLKQDFFLKSKLNNNTINVNKSSIMPDTGKLVLLWIGAKGFLNRAGC